MSHETSDAATNAPTVTASERPSDPPAAKPVGKQALKRYAPLAIVVIGAATVYATGVHRFLSFDALRENYATLTAFVAERFLAALCIYMLAYVVVVALSLPGAGLMTIAGGFLFGAAIGTTAAVVSATAGAILIFIAARTAFGDVLKRQAGGFLKRMEAGFERNAFSYLLLLRVIPAFPFFVVNIAPAFFSVPIRTFAITTLIGVIPGTFAFSSVGNGLGAVLSTGGEISLQGVLLRPEVITPIVAIASLASIPLVAQAMGLRLERRAQSEGDAA